MIGKLKMNLEEAISFRTYFVVLMCRRHMREGAFLT